MREAGIPTEIDAGIAHCHAWLNENAAPPGVLNDLPEESRAAALAAAREDPGLLADMGGAQDEDPSSKAGLVRRLLIAQLAMKRFDELPDRLHAARAVGDPSAFLLDDTTSREAVPILESFLGTLDEVWEDTVERHNTLPQFGLESEPNLRMLNLVESTGMAVQALLTHMRSSLGANVPRGLAELACFRSAWTARLSVAGFSCAEVPLFLGCSAPAEQIAEARVREAARKARARTRVRAQSID